MTVVTPALTLECALQMYPFMLYKAVVMGTVKFNYYLNCFMDGNKIENNISLILFVI